MELNVYLSGEIHTDWRQKIIEGCKQNNLSISFSSAVTDHEASDSAGDLLGKKKQWGQPLAVPSQRNNGVRSCL
jgi:YtoQ family protein